MSDQLVAVIGAGPCGLAACKTLGEFGIAYECLEASAGLGGIWNIERGSGGGYRSLHTNTSTYGMAFSDFPFEDATPVYKNAAQMVDYFTRYADHFGVTRRIRFGTRVTNARPRADGGWRLEFESGEPREYSSVIVASGQYTLPRLPHDSVPGDFSGEHLHVFEYLDAAAPVDMRDKRVVVVGLGNSAAELAAELCDSDAPAGCASQVILSAREGRWIIPKLVDGEPLDVRAPHPAHRVPFLLRQLPSSVTHAIARRKLGKTIHRITDSYGGAEALGLPAPTIAPWLVRPTMSNEFVPALQEGRIDVRPGIDRFDGATVHFIDGTQTEADVILYATGYGINLPYLDKETLGCDPADLRLYNLISHPAHDQLFFVGILQVLCSLWPVAEQQSRWIAKLLSGSFNLPDTAQRNAKAATIMRTEPVICPFYVEELRKEAGGL
jgi:cation diffusion facilitator CzcD-associated flavoprotein CzcO